MNTKILCIALATGLVAVPAVSHADSLLEKIAMVVLADKFGIDTREVVTLHEQTNLSVYELAPIYEGSYYFKQKPATVWQLRNQGLGWGEIAHRVGMQPGQFNKLRNQGAFDQDRFWSNSYQERFNVPSQQVQVVRQRGGTFEDVLGAIIVGKLTNKNPQQIYQQYQTEKSWTTINNTYNVRFEQWQRVSAPVKTYYYVTPQKATKVKSKPSKGTRGHEKQDDRSKGKNKGVGKGNDRGKKGNSEHGKGNGKGKGQAHGNGKGRGKGG